MKRKLFPLIIALMLIISACEFPPTDEPAPEPDSEPVQVEAAPEPSAPEPAQEKSTDEETAEEPAPEPTATFTPTPEEKIDCVELLTPLDLADLPAEGKVVFTWTANEDAESYSLNFVFPDGLELSFTTNETTKNRYMDGFSMHPAYNQSGEHQWNVSALNAAGEELCQSDFFTFTKDVSDGIGAESNSNGDSGNGAPPPDDEGGNQD